jgi:hypothetical protein
MSQAPIITWTQPLLARLQTAYDNAVAQHEQEFTLNIKGKDYQFFTPYAKYLIQHVNTVLKGYRR